MACTEQERRKLQNDVNRLCKRLPFSCTCKENCAELKSRMRRATKCAESREKINRRCFSGGDAGHRTAAKAARAAEKNCRRMYRRKCN